MEQIRTKVRAFILGITGLLVTLLVVRFILVFAGANVQQPLVKVIFDVTGFLLSPFNGFQQLDTVSNLDATAILGAFVYAVFGILISELATAFFYSDPIRVFTELIDAAYKFVEFLLVTRIVLKLFGVVVSQGQFVRQVYGATDWSAGVVASLPFLSGEIDLSAIIMLVIVIALDLATEGVISALREKVTHWQESRQPTSAVSPPQVVSTSPQNITINLPSPVAAPSVEKQIINVQTTPFPQPMNEATEIQSLQVQDGKIEKLLLPEGKEG